MVETGDFVDIRFQDEVRYKKPVGIYWLQAPRSRPHRSSACRSAQARDLALPRALADRCDRRGAADLLGGAAVRDARGAIIAALMMCSCILLGVEARLAKTDAMLLLTTTAAMGALARIYLAWQRGDDPPRPDWPNPAIFWTAIAGGILLKGPLILMLVGLASPRWSSSIAPARWLWRLRPVWGVMWMLVLVLPWFVAIVARSGESFFAAVARQRPAEQGRFRAQESHGAPPGYLLRAVLAHLLAGRGAGRSCGAPVWRGAARARGAIPAGLARAVLDRVRAGDRPSCRTTCCRFIRRSRS